jgi:hypothetical protein
VTLLVTIQGTARALKRWQQRAIILRFTAERSNRGDRPAVIDFADNGSRAPL